MGSEETAQPKGGSGIFRRFSSRRQKPRERQYQRPSAFDDSDSEQDSKKITKQWRSSGANEYLNDPLNCAEPSQETGPGSSFLNSNWHRNGNKSHSTSSTSGNSSRRKGFHDDRSLADRLSALELESHDFDQQKLLELLGSEGVGPLASSNGKVETQGKTHSHSRNASASKTGLPAKGHTHSSSHSSSKHRSHHSANSHSIPSETDLSKASKHRSVPIGFSPRPTPSRSNSNADHKRHPPLTRRPVGLSRSQSVNTTDSNSRYPRHRHSTNSGLSRHASLNARYPGDMSHRPLDQIRSETRAANHSHHLRKRSMARPDTIDALDNIGVGGPYHHDGPYDATLASRNKNKKYSPVEAVRESNMEALKATPYEHIQDSLQKHVPLHGVATIPPGMTDMSGRRMSYEEGADLMREADAPGGAYRRYDFIPYHDDDLKGKGEPSFTIERDAKKQKQRLDDLLSPTATGSAIEMQTNGSPKKNSATVRQRRYSLSDHEGAGASSSLSPRAAAHDASVYRSPSTGHRISEGLKRRFGSIRRKPVANPN